MFSHLFENKLLANVFRMLGVPAAGDEPAQPPAGQGDSPHDATGDPPWVLHIEDDEEFSAAIKARLEAHGVAVVRAFHGVQGYTTAFLHPADAILLDCEMPGAEGDYVLRRLKENPLTQDIPVIVLTGRHDRALARRMMNLGAERYLTKPVEMDVLLAELSRHIDLLPAEHLAI